MAVLVVIILFFPLGLAAVLAAGKDSGSSQKLQANLFYFVVILPTSSI